MYLLKVPRLVEVNELSLVNLQARPLTVGVIVMDYNSAYGKQLCSITLFNKDVKVRIRRVK